jgi:hypothetical protein
MSVPGTQRNGTYPLFRARGLFVEERSPSVWSSVAASAAASVEYADGARLVFGPQSAATFQTGRGLTKRLVLQNGALVAHVPKQAEGAALEASTPHAQARVLDTRFLLAATPAETRLDVIEGRASLTRSADRAAVLVSRGQFAVAAPGTPLVAQSLPGRITESLVALYRFDEGQGATVRDQAGFEPALDLKAESDEGFDWLPSGGLQVAGGAMLGSPQPAEKIVEACRASDELTIEAWVTPARAAQSGPARIVTLSRNTEHRNLTLGQGSRLETPTANQARFVARVRTTKKDGNGEPAIYSPDQTAVPDFAHVVFTRSRDGTERLYVDGIYTQPSAARAATDRWGGRRDAQSLPIATSRDALSRRFAKPLRAALPGQVDRGLASHLAGLDPNVQLVATARPNWMALGRPASRAAFPVARVIWPGRVADRQTPLAGASDRVVPGELGRRVVSRSPPAVGLAVAIAVFFKRRV